MRPPAPSHSLARSLVLSLLLVTAASAATRLQIDSRRSHADFSVRVLWLAHVHGSFTHIVGDLALSASGQDGVVDAWIDVDSARMSHATYTRWLMKPEFFDAARYPRMHFVSDPVPLSRLSRGGRLSGRLTLRGVTRPVDFRMAPSLCPDPGTQPCTLTVNGTIRRSLFGIHGHRAVLSDQVRLGLVIVLAPVS